ncbi:diguanylate cyclase domain-containing protein [Stutzerimonas kunmingensis]|uniref:GGDEF domain-containing protein n=1 Tax=Stutzerimonas kunmingensis TaxID=1211807 RepID=UPI0026F0F18D|nr:diguanylate cyclase [Stutzerimonas kunmingensis]
MPPSLLLVDDDPTLIQLMGRLLGDLGRIRFATSGEAALRQAHAERPDLILLDAEMPGMNGFDTCVALKAAPDLSDVPVIFVTSHTDLDHEMLGFSVGAADFIHKPVSEHILRARVTTHLRLKQMSDELRRLASTDALTELPNRRAFDAALAREWARSLRETQPLCCLMVDIDRFKDYNDLYGHPAGDVCLNSVALALRGALLRPTDMVARYGGEEFAVLLPNSTRDGGCMVAERLLQAVLALHLPHERGVLDGIVSISIGVACSDECQEQQGDAAAGESSSAYLMQRADCALYLAKQQGRARIRMIESPPGAAPPLVGQGVLDDLDSAGRHS